jgi:hypothetical protein
LIAYAEVVVALLIEVRIILSQWQIHHHLGGHVPMRRFRLLVYADKVDLLATFDGTT